MKKIKKLITIFICALIMVCCSLLGMACQSENNSSSSESSEEEKIELTLSKSSLELLIGETETLTVENAGETLFWNSSNDAILTVQDGVLTAISVGTAVVSVRSETGVAECVVNVFQSLPSATWITLNGGNVRLYKTDVYQLSLTGKKGTETIDVSTVETVWTTSNSDVVTVENGLVTAIGIGEAVIDVICTIEGEKILASCQFWVIPKIEMILENETKNLSPMIEEKKLSVVCNEISGEEKESISLEELTFTSLTPDILMVNDDGSYDIVGGGEAKVQVNYKDYCTNVFEFTVYNHIVETESDLEAIKTDESGYYLMLADLDFTGKEFPTTSKFSGMLNGNGYSISNVSFVSAMGASMFGELSGVLCNIEFRNVTLSPIGASWGDMVGDCALLADSFSGKICNMYLQGTLHGRTAVQTDWADYRGWGMKAGFIIRQSNDGVMENCVIDVSVDEGTDVQLMSAINPVKVKNVIIYSSTNSMPSNLGLYEAEEENDLVLGTYQDVVDLKNAFEAQYWAIGQNAITLNNQSSIEDCRPWVDVEFYNGNTYLAKVQIRKGSKLLEKDLPKMMGNLLIADYNCQFGVAVNETLKLYPKFCKPISTKAEFLSMDLDGGYYLTQDIDLSGAEHTKIAGDFSGVLDGNGYAIKNVTLQATLGDGIFEKISGTVRRISFENVVSHGLWEISIISNTGLIAQTISGTLEDVYIQGTLAGYSTGKLDPSHWGNAYNGKAGAICSNGTGATFSNVIVNVEFSENTDAYWVCGGAPTYGAITLLTPVNQPAMCHDDYSYLPLNWFGAGTAESLYSIWENQFCIVSPGIWNIVKGEIPTLIKNCSVSV